MIYQILVLQLLTSLRDLKNISYLTVHINGGLEMLKAVKKVQKKLIKN